MCPFSALHGTPSANSLPRTPTESSTFPLSPVVGYAKSDLRFGATMLTPQFLNIGSSSAMPLESIKPVGVNIDTEGGLYIQTLDNHGKDVDTYMWINWGGADIGWMDGDFALVEGVTFAPGTGLWVTGASTDDGIQTAGQVSANDCVVQLRFGATATGNPFPTSVKLQDILPEGNNIDTEGGLYIQTLDNHGKDVDTYMWINWGGADIGWMDGDFALVEGVTFAPGTGLWVTGASTENYLRIPAPEL